MPAREHQIHRYTDWHGDTYEFYMMDNNCPSLKKQVKLNDFMS